jgi:hypothetical protein
MKGYAHRFPRTIKVEIWPEDVYLLKQGEILKYKNVFPSENDIPLILFNVAEKSIPQRILSEPGFSVTYYPLGNSQEITTCSVKIDKSKFEELLEKEWVGTRHDGTDHLHIQIYHPTNEIKNKS